MMPLSSRPVARFPRRTYFRVLPAVMMLIPGVSACTANDEPPPAPASTGIDAAEASGPTDGLQLVLGLERVNWEAGSTIVLRITVLNRLDQPRTLTFSDGQRVDAIILDENEQEVARWSADQSFTMAFGEETFEPGDDGWTRELEITAPDTPGRYQLRGMLVPVEGRLEAGLPLEISPRS